MAKYCCCEHFYDLNDFVEGAVVTFRELPVRMAKKLRLLLDEDFTIKSTKVRVNNLGDLTVFFELDQLPGEYVSPNVLQVKKTDATPTKRLRDNTLKALIEDNIELNQENAKLRHALNRGLKGDFESE